MTSSNGWQKLLQTILARTDERLAVVGVGHELRGDDAVGIVIVRHLQSALPKSDKLLLIEAGSAPENITGQIRRFKPHQVLLIDALDMGLPAGTPRFINIERDILEPASTTHTLSLSLLAKYLQMDLRCAVVLLGVQVEQTDLDAPLSASVQTSANDIVEIFATHYSHVHILG